MNLAHPLDLFPLIRARDTEGARQALSTVYSGNMNFVPLARSGSVDITVNSCELSQTGLNYTGYGAGVRVRFSGSRFVTLSFPTAGDGNTIIGGTERLLGPARGLIMPADASFAADLNAEYEHVVLRMDPKALEDKLAAMLGVAVTKPLTFNPILEFSGVHGRLLRDNFFFLVEMVSRFGAHVPRLLQAEFEQAIMVMFLYASRHDYSHLMEDDAVDVTPAEVRRAEAYIEAHWREPIALEDLAAVTGVSGISLFRSFKTYRGYTPGQFAERVRNRMRKW